MAAEPVSTPNEAPAEIKSLIDTVLGGFNNKDSALYNSAFGQDAVVTMGSLPIAGQVRIRQPAGSRMQRSGCTSSASRMRISRATGLSTPQLLERTLMLSFPRRSSSS